MIQRDKRVKPLNIGALALLPVYPPEINAVFLIGLVNHIKI